MKVFVALFGIIGAVALCGSLGRQAQGAPDDRAQIAALYTTFVKALNKKDINGVMSVYIHDKSLFAFDVSPPREYVGWDAYREDYKAFFDAVKGPLSEHVSELQINVSGDSAFTHGVARIRSTLKQGGALDVALRFTDVLRKMNGKWLIVHEHLSVPVDLATGKAVMH